MEAHVATITVNDSIASVAAPKSANKAARIVSLGACERSNSMLDMIGIILWFVLADQGRLRLGVPAPTRTFLCTQGLQGPIIGNCHVLESDA